MVCPMLDGASQKSRYCDNREHSPNRSPILIVVVAILTYKGEICEEVLLLKIMV